MDELARQTVDPVKTTSEVGKEIPQPSVASTNITQPQPPDSTSQKISPP